MVDRQATDELLFRLKQERDAGDRAYNDLLTAVDRLLRVATPVPSAPDAGEPISRLNDTWRTGEYPAAGRGLQLRRRLFNLARFFLGDHLDRQQAFNAAVTAYVNTTGGIAADILGALRAHLDATAIFRSTLVRYFQTITLYVDSKDRLLAGELRSVLEGAPERIDAVFDVLDKRYESLATRERRLEQELAEQRRGMESELKQIREAVAIANQLGFTLKRALEAGGVGAGAAAAASPPPAGEPSSAPAALDAFKYVEFENQFRGTREDIRERQRDYLAVFAGSRDVVDLGCGRGEFLDLLREAGIPARGVDLNAEMVEACAARGLTASAGDALAFLQAQPDGSLGGVFAAQVVEHLEPDYLARLIETAFHKLRPASTIVLETINPRCWFAFFESFIRDLSHVRPIHPETLGFLLQASGFQQVEIRYRAPYDERHKLQPIAPRLPDPESLAGWDLTGVLRHEVVDVINANVEKLNRLLFSYLDYAAIGRKF